MVSDVKAVKHVVLSPDGATAVVTGHLTYDYLMAVIGASPIRVLTLAGGLTMIACSLSEGDAINHGLQLNHAATALANIPSPWVWGRVVIVGPLSFGDVAADVSANDLSTLLAQIQEEVA
jgi:hypothetical protein